MKTKRVNEKQVKKIADCLMQGGIVAFRTDTVFGLACSAESKVGYQKIMEAKQRPLDKPLPMMLADMEDIFKVAKIDEDSEKLIREFAPGAMTFILKKKDCVADWVTHCQPTIAIRIPDDDFIRGLIRHMNIPLLVTSANSSGKENCYTVEQVLEQLDGRIDLIVEGVAAGQIASTIVDCTRKKKKVVRLGKITQAEIDKILQEEKEMKVAIACDHGGYEVKEKLVQCLKEWGYKVQDFGCYNGDSVDYPDFAYPCAKAVAGKEADKGIVICGTGIGVSMTCNKVPSIRCALVTNAFTAPVTREHNDSNIIAFGARVTAEEDIINYAKTWLSTPFSQDERHIRRINKLTAIENGTTLLDDSELEELIRKEEERQKAHIELIASENYVSMDVRRAMGSCLTNKYAEGYPGKRYYGGCEIIDEIEELARQRACKLFDAEHANVQPHSGSQANMAVYMAVCQPGDTILGMDLNAGGHLTHGSPVSFSGKLYNFVSYGVNKDTELIDYEELRQKALVYRPKLIVVGASAYSRIFDFKMIRDICDEAGSLMMVDMAHIAGLVAAKVHPSPVPFADFVTSTTHKTLRGPRGGLILCKEKYAQLIDKAVFPQIQGGPLEHVIAAKAVCFKEAMGRDFARYSQQVINNCKTLATSLRKEGFRIVSGATENHVLLVDVKTSCGLTGKAAEALLEEVGLTCNKNMIPFDTEKPSQASGIRLGTAAMTTRGFKEAEFKSVAKWISTVLHDPENEECHHKVKDEIDKLMMKF